MGYWYTKKVRRAITTLYRIQSRKEAKKYYQKILKEIILQGTIPIE